MIKKQQITSLVIILVLILSACVPDSGSSVRVLQTQTLIKTGKLSAPPKPIPTVFVKVGPYGTITDRLSSPPFSKNSGTQAKDLIFNVDFSQPGAKQFQTQAIKCNDIAYLKVTVYGIGIGAPLLPTGVDGFDMITPTDKCSEVVTVPNVPYGTARIGKFEAFDSGRAPIPGATIQAVFDVNANPTNVEISYRGTPNSQAVEGILTSPNPLIASHMSLPDLVTLIDGITGQGGTFPNYTYTTHPALVNTANLVTDLLANDGDSTALSSANAAYKIAPATVTGTIAGLAGSDTAQIQINDPASPISVGNGNGAFSFTTNVKDGSWTVYAFGSGGTSYTASGTPAAVVGAGGSVDVGTITLTPATPTLVSASPLSGQVGDTITLRGSLFHTTVNGNTISFGGAIVPNVDVTVVNTTELSVKVPAGASGSNVNLTVAVGSQTSNALIFDVIPKVNSIAPTSGLNDESIEVTITGSGFEAGSSVEVGGVPMSPVIFDSSTQLRVDVTGLPAGAQDVTVINPGPNSDTLSGAYTSQARAPFGWSIASLGYTNPVTDIIAHPTDVNKAYASIDSEGVFETTDGGVNWIVKNTGITDLEINDLAYEPGNPTTLYAGTQSAGLFKSTDNGANWTAINTGLDLVIKDLAVSPSNTSILFAGTGEVARVYKSIDGGANWSASNTGLPAKGVSSIEIHPTNPLIVYVGFSNNGGLWKTIDGGTSWTQLTTGISATGKIRALAIHPSTPTTIWATDIDADNICQSTDSGANFTCYAAAEGYPNLKGKEIALHPTNTSIAYVATDAQVYKTINGGSNWTLQNTGFAGTDTTSLAISPVNTSILYAGTEMDINKTTDAAANWTDLTGNNVGDTNINAIDADPTNFNTIYAATDDRLYKSTDASSNWTALSTGLPAGKAFYSVAVDPGTPSRIYAGSSTDGFYRSTDSGSTWTQITAGISLTANVQEIEIDPVNNNRVFAVDDQSVCLSTDAGLNFTCGAASGDTIVDLDITPAGTTLYASTGGGVYESTDDGVSWTARNTGLGNTDVREMAVDSNNPSIVYAGTHGGAGVYRSTDGALNWTGVAGTGLTDSVNHNLQINSATPTTLYVVTHGGFFKSVDSGANWTDETGALPGGCAGAQTCQIISNPNDASQIYVAIHGTGVYRSF